MPHACNAIFFAMEVNCSRLFAHGRGNWGLVCIRGCMYLHLTKGSQLFFPEAVLHIMS